MPTLSLTNRVKNLKLLFLFIMILVFCCLMDVFFPKIYATGCNNNVYDFTRGARMGTGIVYDTTKPKTFNPIYLKKLDSLASIANNFLGRAMTVDNYLYWNGVFVRIITELRTDTTLRK